MMEERTIVMEKRAVAMEKRTVVTEKRTVVMEERALVMQPAVTGRGDGDDWFVLFQSVVEASRKMPTGTASYHLKCSVDGGVSDGR